ncbi:hypothetical protein C8R47DRAFT_1181551 [Mycena vitilis]|nr:hypothetical protein C8R47DRAFT_1181551 [Mycena vitilis]
MTYPDIPPPGQSWPLPSAEDIGLDANGTSAWEVLLCAEAAALLLPKATAKYQDSLVAVRVLGWLLKDAWHHSQWPLYARLAHEIVSCNRVDAPAAIEQQEINDKVFKLGLDIRNHFFRVWAVPTPASHASRPSYDEHRTRVLARMTTNDGQTRRQAKENALLRDGYRCVLTGLYDKVSLGDMSEVKARARRELSQIIHNIDTEAAHLFSKSAQSHEEYAARCYKKLLGNRVNNLWNVMTMCVTLHRDFDHFKFWLEAVPGEEHTYDVVARDPAMFFAQIPSPPRRITLRVDPKAIADCIKQGKSLDHLCLPDPQLMAIRAACARVSAMSGAADHMQKLMHDRDDAQTLVDSDDTVYLLDSLLRTVQVA